jgi:hypothetical protein
MKWRDEICDVSTWDEISHPTSRIDTKIAMNLCEEMKKTSRETGLLTLHRPRKEKRKFIIDM